MYTVSNIREWLDKAIASLVLPKEPDGLYAPASYMITIGGKRLRPMLCLLAGNLFTDRIDQEMIMPALGIEIFHTFTLVHDDIMDQSATRRNRPTVHCKWNTNTAILSGDVMCIAAYQHLCQANPAYQAEILRLFNRTAAQVCEGQQLDMDYESHPVVTEAEYLQMIELKTAALLAASATIGAIAGGATAQDAARIYAFGRWLGLAFQIQDDLLDVFGEAGVFGKNIGNDIVRNKKTFLLTLALQQAAGKDKTLLFSLLTGKQIDPARKIEEMLDIYRRLQIRPQVEARIVDYFGKAMGELDNLSVAPDRQQYLRQFTENYMERTQ
ncbi:MAG: polyprenyl synthetase family protein [Prevotellaceae bacterium]|jgi:geranylgeranyl diphosphate synthase type II|nr:polyprenyl synthetase family protein [Prevotellaceae bacterium]